MNSKRHTMRAVAAALAVVVALALGVAVTVALGAPTTGEPYYIGLFAPMTGENAEYGRSFKQAITLFVDELNAAGGIYGRPVQIVDADDRSDPREAANISQRFASDRRILATIGSFSSTASMAAAPILERAGVVQLSPTSSHPDFTRIGTYQFRNTTIQSLEAPQVARFAVQRMGAKSIAVAYRQDDWGLSASRFFQEAAQKMGARIVLSEGFIPGERDFRPFITKVRAQNPDLVHIAMFYADAAVLAQQMEQAGLSLPVVTSSSLYHPEFLSQGGSAVEGYYIPANFFPGNPAPHVQAFVKAYEQRWGRTPDSFGSQAYDSIGVIVAAIRHVIDSGMPLTRQSLRDAMYAMPPYRGVTGMIKFDENGDVVKSLTWLVVRDDKLVLVPEQ